MGCSASTQGSSATSRMIQYQKESQQMQQDLRLEPNTLDPENYRDGYISVNQFYNHFHNGFCAPYIINPNYMLIIDFRTCDEYIESHIITSHHHRKFRWDSSTIEDFRKFSMIIFYDHDGTSAANLHSSCNLAYRILTTSQIEVNCILGGLQTVQEKFPHLVKSSLIPPQNIKKINEDRRISISSAFSVSSSDSVSTSDTDTSTSEDEYFEKQRSDEIPWMPTLVHGDHLFLGRRDQAEDGRVIEGLGITNVVSIGRSPLCKFKNVCYAAFDGERNLYVTFLAACEYIDVVLESGGRVLVHGIDGLNRSAAVVLAYMMSAVVCSLEEVVYYLQVLKPHLNLDDTSVVSLLRWERSIFNRQLTNVDDLWL